MDTEPILELEGVAKTFPGFALDDASFSLPRGFVMGLVGPNGAGKTTLVRLILDLERPDAGSVRVFGADPGERPDIRSRIGFVHETQALYDSLSVARTGEAIGRFYRTWDPARFRMLIGEFGLPSGRRVGTLSHGMRTRLALALALSHDAELLVLDEPTSGLDPVFRRELLDRLSEFIGDGRRSILFSTHITSDLDRIGDYITYLQGGRVVFSSPRDGLEQWAVVKGGPELLDRVRDLLRGVETGAMGFVGLTEDADAVRRRLAGEDLVVERATLEDIVYLNGRTGPAGVDLHGAAR